jgi:hypothetical protein
MESREEAHYNPGRRHGEGIAPPASGARPDLSARTGIPARDSAFGRQYRSEICGQSRGRADTAPASIERPAPAAYSLAIPLPSRQGHPSRRLALPGSAAPLADLGAGCRSLADPSSLAGRLEEPQTHHRQRGARRASRARSAAAVPPPLTGRGQMPYSPQVADRRTPSPIGYSGCERNLDRRLRPAGRPP